MPDWTSDELFAALKMVIHADEREWLLVKELRTGTGYERGAMQRLDAWAMNYYPSEQWRRIAYELKVSRGDFLSELKNPLKRRAGLALSNQFYFVVPAGLVKPGEIPIPCGMIEVGRSEEPPTKALWSRGRRKGWISGESKYWMFETVPAQWRDIEPPSWAFLGALTRSIRAEDG